jgi:heme-degrading monooxygenase HmoA
MVLTILEATVAPDRVPELKAAFHRAGDGGLPPGLIRSHLLSSATDPARWRIQTLWASREALAAMRQTGTPAGILMFRAAGAEPSLSIYEVASSIEAPTA